MFLFLLTFFGLTPEYRLTLFSQIHEICFWGQGGYSWDVVYNWPNWLRNFTYMKLKDYYDKQKEESESNILKNKDKETLKPNIIKPDWVSKRSTNR